VRHPSDDASGSTTPRGFRWEDAMMGPDVLHRGEAPSPFSFPFPFPDRRSGLAPTVMIAFAASGGIEREGKPA
jgi:hypothetical protein